MLKGCEREGNDSNGRRGVFDEAIFVEADGQRVKMELMSSRKRRKRRPQGDR